MSREISVTWKPLAPELGAAQVSLGSALVAWDRTPYRAGKQDRGVGVDCVRFVAAVLDSVRGRATPIETLPDDAALHNRAAAIAGMLALRRALEPNVLLRTEAAGEIEPGDILVTGPVGGGPGHAMIVGHEPNTLWESSNTGVRRVGLSSLRKDGVAVFYVFRCTDRDRWGTDRDRWGS